MDNVERSRVLLYIDDLANTSDVVTTSHHGQVTCKVCNMVRMEYEAKQDIMLTLFQHEKP